MSGPDPDTVSREEIEAKLQARGVFSDEAARFLTMAALAGAPSPKAGDPS